MKKYLRYFVLLVVSIVLVACGKSGSKEEGTSTKITVGASNVPHAAILEQAKPLLKEEGIDLEIITYNDYVLPNAALEEGDIDANYFQHIPYFEKNVEEHHYDFVNLGSIHLEPMGAYSKKYKSLSELPDGATILVSNSVTDHGRVLAILQEAQLIKVKDGVELSTADFEDIEDNPKNLVIDYEYDPALMTTLLEQDEGDVVFINSNFAVDHGISPLTDAIAIESSSSPYANIIAARSEDKDSEALKKLVEVLHSDKIKDFILKEWKGAVVPVD
ncbi:MetQ/NlpA family ABC transporter substrate-binding protein [Allofustis seminis]|uniref:MetQ/NlpA family ABC transporter substrate-binding protein n=1 Tax=Allofustis seminis TaxID=166939 RepID=UPI00036FAB23|nr:MetQ/NlpA family ABC transporter substrate-binding protein [Allofustis seminis]